MAEQLREAAVYSVADITVYHDDVLLNTVAETIIEHMYNVIANKFRKDIADKVIIIYTQVLFNKTLLILNPKDVIFILSL